MRTAQPQFFPSPADWRRWLSKHHADTDEVWVGFYKRASGKPSITWPESVDEALCFGWIDGIRGGMDDESYMIRFTPRRSGSTWSAVNVRRVAELTKLGRMRAPGLRAYEARTEDTTAVYSFEQRKTVKLPREFEREFRAHADAWRFFKAQAPWYRRTTTWWVVSAKREETQRKRLAMLITDSARGRRIGPLARQKPNTRNTEGAQRTRKDLRR